MYCSDDSPYGIHAPLSGKAAAWGLVSLMLCSSLLFAGCATHYYKVSDPVTGRTYYTDDLERIEGDGVELKDSQTGDTVTIQNSEVREINEYEYDTGRLRSKAPY